jgi:pimeloyl-ACP methyl ester carboxylesterase
VATARQAAIATPLRDTPCFANRLRTVRIIARYRRDMGLARERVARSAIANTARGPIEYAEAGAGDPVLIVHGAGGGFDQGLDIGAALASHGFRVIAMSRFGYLRTGLPADASPTAQADAHTSLLDALQIQQAAILGASAGAPSSMQLALRHPGRCRALVLVVPVAFVPHSEGSAPGAGTTATEVLFRTVLQSDFLFWAGIQYSPTTLIRWVLATPPAAVARASPQEQARIDQTLNHALPISLRGLGLRNDVAVIARLPRYDLEQIAVPTLAISAADDGFGTLDGARYTAAHIAHARLVAYPDGGHMLVGRQDAAVAEIAAFVRGS